jgi:drug/metabolite transporter (DMT)-like permease
MGALLGMLVAVGYGSADFFGGWASKRSPTTAVVVTSQLCSLLLGFVLVGVFWTAVPDAGDLMRAALAGVLNMVGIAALYHGLAIGKMSVVAPVTAVTGGTIPIMWGLAFGERPSTLAVVGILAAIVAVGLVAGGEAGAPTDGHTSKTQELVLAVTAGIAFSSAFLLFAHTNDDSSMWPVLVARLSSVPLAFIAVLAARRALVPRRDDAPLVVGTGVLDAGSNALLLLAVRDDLISEVAPLASLAPAWTVVWARFVLHEPITRVQVAGLTLALGGLVCIGVG